MNSTYCVEKCSYMEGLETYFSYKTQHCERKQPTISLFIFLSSMSFKLRRMLWP